MKEQWIDSHMGIDIKKLSYSHTPSFVARSAFFYIQAAGHFHCSGDYYMKREGYRSFLFFYTIRGKGHIKYRGKQYEAGENQVFLMDCYEYQEYSADTEQQWEFKWLHFNGGTSGEYFTAIYDNYGPLITLGRENKVECCLDELLTMLDTKDMQLEIKAAALIVQILTEVLLAASTRPGIYKGNSQNAQVEAAIDFMESNFNSDILLEDIAKAACCSMYHFTRVFKRFTGFSPYEYLVKFRINKAKILLKTTSETVEEIAESVGFGSTSSFIKTFRDLEATTPLKYRKFWAG
jgi:AraC-like DNA-binding protein